jgi:hypothetical protein
VASPNARMRVCEFATRSCWVWAMHDADHGQSGAVVQGARSYTRTARQPWSGHHTCCLNRPSIEPESLKPHGPLIPSAQRPTAHA